MMKDDFNMYARLTPLRTTNLFFFNLPKAGQMELSFTKLSFHLNNY